MAAFLKFEDFVLQLAKGTHQLDVDDIRVALTNTAPVATQTEYDSAVDHPPPVAASGYPSGGAAVTVLSMTQTGGLLQWILDSIVFTASGGSIGPFRYAILYNNTPAGKNLIGWYDYGSSKTLASGESLTVAFDAVNGVLNLQ